MGHEKKNILMLGWEFPPVFTGGLGVACYNIVKALSATTNIHLIVPFASAESNIENVGITGLNQLEQEFSNEITPKEFSEFFLERIPIALSAYPSINAQVKRRFEKKNLDQESLTVSTWPDVSAWFRSDHLYGWDVLQRTQLFALAAKHLGLKRDFDIIHAHDWPTFEAALEIKHTTHKPLVLHVHSLETDRSGEKVRNDIYALEQNGLQEADKIIAVSEYTRQQIISHYGVDGSKIEVAHNGAEVTQQSSFVKKTGEKWVTFVGRITFQKGPQFIVETARKLIRVFPNVKFIVAGQGDLFPALIHEVARQRLGKYFSFTGVLSRKKIKDLLACSDAYFMPSVSEPFGLSAIEAVQQGTAGVISTRSGAAEVLNNCLKADFWDTDRFANYLYAILTYPRLKNAIERQSQKDIEHLTWDKTVEKIMSIYRTCLA
jgi:glycosyltransferase involved in cell wall biosynthesis